MNNAVHTQTQSVQIRLIKDRDGWNAKSSITLPDNRELQIRTSKRSNGTLATTATVYTTKDGYMTHAFGLGIPGKGDFSSTVISSKPARVTEKVVEEQQRRGLAHLETIQAQIRAHYASVKSTAEHPEPTAVHQG
ncbi:hypothetical protein [Hydrogenophaga atypica]|jgi:hypothetical protein|uniref:Uncharacterized protein n=1 Tax=Hydrogenophaga atypica TaxID=249409 RepID=A0ABW2QMV0_9BURK